MIENIPNWHPLFVHFPIGLFMGSIVLHGIGFFISKEETRGNLRIAANWMLWSGAAATVFTLLSGWLASMVVAHTDESHAEMILHRNWAISASVIFFILTAWSIHHMRKGRTLPNLFYGLLLLGGILLGITGWEGGELVYEHGMGVEPMEKIIGDSHDHDGHDADDGEEEESGHGHDSETTESEDGHHHDSEPAKMEHTEEEDDHHHVIDESTPAGAVDSFHNALTRGDKEAVYRLLAEDVLIFESGGAERSLEEYAGHHMPLDMEFSKNMKREVTAQSIQESGDTAIVFNESQTEGTFKNKKYNLLGKETVILKRNEGQWKITHIHWSSMPDNK